MIDPVAAGVVAAVVVFAAYVAMTVGATALTWYHRRRTRRRDHRRDALRAALFDRVDREDPALDDWIAGLAGEDRDLLADVVVGYLRTIRGADRGPYLAAAEALWLGERAEAALDAADPLDRVEALSTLAVLAYPIDIDAVEAAAVDRRTRECAARLVLERRDEIDHHRHRGTRLLIGDGDEPLSVYGLGTLESLTTGRESPLLALADAQSERWHPDLLVQVCRVVEHAEQLDPDAPLDWLFPLLEADDPAVRAAATRAFTHLGHRRDLRRRIPINALLADESPRVRRATYETLAYWGDAVARDRLTWSVISEDDPRAQLVAIRGLLSMGADPDRDSPGWPTEAWAWIDAELAVSDRRRLPTEAS